MRGLGCRRPRLWAGRSPTVWQQAIAQQTTLLHRAQRQSDWLVTTQRESLLRSPPTHGWEATLADCLARDKQADSLPEPDVSPSDWRPSSPPLAAIGTPSQALPFSRSQPRSQARDDDLGSAPLLKRNARSHLSPASSLQTSRSSRLEVASSAAPTQLRQDDWPMAAAATARQSPAPLRQLPAQADRSLLSHWGSEIETSPRRKPVNNPSKLLGLRRSLSPSPPLPLPPTALSQAIWQSPARRTAQRLQFPSEETARSPLSHPPSGASTQKLLSQIALPLEGPTAPLGLLQAFEQVASRSPPPHKPTERHSAPTAPQAPAPPFNPRSADTASRPVPAPAHSFFQALQAVSTQPFLKASSLAENTQKEIKSDAIESNESEHNGVSLLPADLPRISNRPSVPALEASLLTPLSRQITLPQSEASLQQLATQLQQILEEEARRQGIDL